MSITITAEIKALVGQKVLVKNYRVRCREDWEIGEVVQTAIYVYSFNKYRVSYDVVLDRKTVSGKPIRVYVSDDSIKPI